MSIRLVGSPTDDDSLSVAYPPRQASQLSQRRIPHLDLVSTKQSSATVNFGTPTLVAEHRVGLRRLRWFEGITAAFHLVQAVALAALVTQKHGSLAAPVSIPYTTWPSHNSTGAARHYSYPKPYVVGKLHIEWMIFAFFMLSFAFQAFAVSPLYYPTFKRLLVEHYAQPLRWIEYSVSASLMILIFAVLDNILDFTFLFLLFAAFFLLQWLGMLSEMALAVRKNAEQQAARLDAATAELDMLKRELAASSTEATGMISRLQEHTDETRGALLTGRWYVFFLPHMLGWLIYIVVSGIFVIKFDLAIVNAPDDVPSWVTFLYSIQFIIMSLFGVVQLAEEIAVYRLPPDRCPSVAIAAETAYTVLSLTAKSVLAWILYANLLAEKGISYA